jgi:transposase
MTSINRIDHQKLEVRRLRAAELFAADVGQAEVALEFAVAYHPSHVWWLLRHRLGWSPQRPIRQAKERDQAAVQRWVDEDWPRIKLTPDGAEPA